MFVLYQNILGVLVCGFLFPLFFIAFLPENSHSFAYQVYQVSLDDMCLYMQVNGKFTRDQSLIYNVSFAFLNCSYSKGLRDFLL